MLTLDGIRGYIAGLGEYNMVYIGKMDNKREHSIGVYPRKASGQPVTALGGPQYSSYDIRRISLLIHWDKDVRASEQAAYELFEKLRNVSSPMIGDTRVNQISLKVPEPQPVGTDDNGVYEYVIWLDFVYQRKRGKRDGRRS